MVWGGVQAFIVIRRWGSLPLGLERGAPCHLDSNVGLPATCLERGAPCHLTRTWGSLPLGAPCHLGLPATWGSLPLGAPCHLETTHPVDMEGFASDVQGVGRL
jgi:hypothetical protein